MKKLPTPIRIHDGGQRVEQRLRTDADAMWGSSVLWNGEVTFSPGSGPLTLLASEVATRADPSCAEEGNAMVTPDKAEMATVMQASQRGTQRVVGCLFIAATVASIAGSAVQGTILDGNDYLNGLASHDSRLIIATLLYIVAAVSAVGTSILLFPFLRPQSNSGALGYVVMRVFENLLSFSVDFMDTTEGRHLRARTTDARPALGSSLAVTSSSATTMPTQASRES